MSKINNIISAFLVFICFTVILENNLAAQEVEASSTQIIDKNTPSRSSFEEGEYRPRISQEYLRKFTSMSKDLEKSKQESSSLSYRLEAIKERKKQVKEKQQQQLFVDNISSLKLTLNALDDKMKLQKRAIRLLQENKSESNANKNKVLLEVSKIEAKIADVQKQYEEDKMVTVINAVDIDDRNVYENPAKDDCNITFNGIDPITKKEKLEVNTEFLFGYTHPKLRSYFKDDAFMKCEAKIVKLDKKYFMWLYINIASKDANKTYGRIEQLSTLKFELLDGEILYLQNAQNANGQLEAYTGNTNYEIILPIEKSKLKMLSKSEIDRIGIMWTSGYEQYDIYNIDVIKNQIECLKSM